MRDREKRNRDSVKETKRDRPKDTEKRESGKRESGKQKLSRLVCIVYRAKNESAS